MLKKDKNIEQPIPDKWRPVIKEIVERIRFLGLKSGGIRDSRVEVSPDDIDYINRNIVSYGDELTKLSDETWSTSICRWMDGYWHLLIDLCTSREGLSDLVLFIDVYERDDGDLFKVLSVHVP